MNTEIRENAAANASDAVSEDRITYSKLFWLFLAGSVAGVVVEGIFCLTTKGRWESHVVSVFAQYNILYGFGAVLFYVGAAKLKNKPILFRVVSMAVIATVLELVCGLVLLYGLGMRAWNYEHNFLNYKGIVCLSFSFAWGLAAFFFCKLYPRIRLLLSKFSAKPWFIASGILSVLVIYDLGLTGISIIRWSERHYGIPAESRLQKECDIEAPDDYMKKRFVEWQFVEPKQES